MNDTSHPGFWDFADALSDGVYGIEPNGHCSFINAAALRMLGYASADELVGQTLA